VIHFRLKRTLNRIWSSI